MWWATVLQGVPALVRVVWGSHMNCKIQNTAHFKQTKIDLASHLKQQPYACQVFRVDGRHHTMDAATVNWRGWGHHGVTWWLQLQEPRKRRREKNEQCEPNRQPYMCQVVRDAMSCLTLDVADAVIGRWGGSRGCHGVTTRQTLASVGRARRERADASEGWGRWASYEKQK